MRRINGAEEKKETEKELRGINWHMEGRRAFNACGIFGIPKTDT